MRCEPRTHHRHRAASNVLHRRETHFCCRALQSDQPLSGLTRPAVAAHSVPSAPRLKSLTLPLPSPVASGVGRADLAINEMNDASLARNRATGCRVWSRRPNATPARSGLMLIHGKRRITRSPDTCNRPASRLRDPKISVPVLRDRIDVSGGCPAHGHEASSLVEIAEPWTSLRSRFGHGYPETARLHPTAVALLRQPPRLSAVAFPSEPGPREHAPDRSGSQRSSGSRAAGTKGRKGADQMLPSWSARTDDGGPEIPCLGEYVTTASGRKRSMPSTVATPDVPFAVFEQSHHLVAR